MVSLSDGGKMRLKSELSLNIYIPDPRAVTASGILSYLYINFITNTLHFIKYDKIKRVKKRLFKNEILQPLLLLPHRQRFGRQRPGNLIQRQ